MYRDNNETEGFVLSCRWEAVDYQPGGAGVGKGFQKKVKLTV